MKTLGYLLILSGILLFFRSIVVGEVCLPKSGTCYLYAEEPKEYWSVFFFIPVSAIMAGRQLVVDYSFPDFEDKAILIGSMFFSYLLGQLVGYLY